MKRERGFTLVELLTVIGILALLVAILVPAVNGVRGAAKKTVTVSTISALSTGLEQFRADQRIGGKYPPSASDRLSGNNLDYEIANPYQQLDGHNGGTDVRMSGAGFLVFALAGADLLGPPGFKTTRSGSQYWSDDTDDIDGGTAITSGIYALDSNREPRTARTAPLVDLSKVEVSRFKDSSFTIPAEEKARKALGQNGSPERRYPVFLDSFDGPILYWRADKAGVRIADRSPTESDSDERGIYHYEDNAPLLEGQNAVWMNPSRNVFGGDDPHDLLFATSAVGDNDLVDAQKLREGIETDRSFARVIQNLDVNARSEPQNPKSFILLSAGPDGIFGTTDDIGNIEPNGR